MFTEIWWPSTISLPFVCGSLLSIIFLAARILYKLGHRQRFGVSATTPLVGAREKNEKDGHPLPYLNIEPKEILSLQNEQPFQLRPFKPKYHLTMALENLTFSELLLMDKTYDSRVRLRRDLIETHEQDTVACNPKGSDAVLELYHWLTTIYLPRRFPQYFILNGGDKKSSSTTLFNTLTNECIPLQPSSPTSALKILGAHVDTDFFILLPNSTTGKYHLEAFLNCFPSGFNARLKLSLPLAAVHQPVPGYQEKIEKSMDRFFASLPNGRIVKRANWGITTTRELFVLEGTHGHVEDANSLPNADAHPPGEGATKRDRESGEEDDHLDLHECVLRCERQTLHRLPNTGALVFAFKTYQYELADIRDEGNGEALAEAIDGLKAGNVPSMNVYKRAAVWGERVKEFLRA